MTTISAPQLTLSVPCLKCHTAVQVKANILHHAKKSGIFCPDCLPSKQKPAPAVWSKATYRDYLKTEHWQTFRLYAFEFYGRKCYLCGATDCQLDIHHNTYERLGGEMLSDVIILCHDCHQGYEDWKRGSKL